jgi:hypothetical protein
MVLMRQERESTSTRLNAANAMKLLNIRYPHIHRMILVTNRFHQWRALRVFQQVARELFPLPSQEVNDSSSSRSRSNESDSDLWQEASDSVYSFIIAPMQLDSAVPQVFHYHLQQTFIRLIHHWCYLWYVDSGTSGVSS